eukprot:CAMPEP_0115845830 /NCGR_PEP_ID=MMETSP0287-20121206/9555_1 /TAXON_ID=412157 /ORGANISM="Chrysochromulina rotalis, Strain UIO044" /LENGTH=392 /DNA_ID=CAMNT_0003299617 /DNA_START=27 /DNA_END=1205 /DNA_ORIENTATION=-
MASSSSSVVVGIKQCELRGCNRPVFVDPLTKIPHDFCGRTHAREAQAGQGLELPPPHGQCHVCRLPECGEQVYFDAATDRVHEYCCKFHADEALQRGLRTRSNRALQGHAHPAHRCSLTGCSAPRYVDEHGHEHPYCGRTHAKLAEQRGLEAVDASEAPQVSAVWRGRQGEPPYTISVLTNQHPKYQGIKDQFISTWTGPGPKPTVQRVLQIRNPQPIFDRYLTYQAGHRHEVRRFHGTGMVCEFAINPNQRPCEHQHCAVCSIAAQAFSMARAGGGPNAALMPAGLRYGRGLYFSRTASKSNDYARMSERKLPHGRYRAMFLCKVCVGQTHLTKQDRLDQSTIDQLLSSGQADSVTGLTTADGGALNFEENVVYDEHAAIPSYLIVYTLND